MRWHSGYHLLRLGRSVPLPFLEDAPITGVGFIICVHFITGFHFITGVGFYVLVLCASMFVRWLGEVSARVSE